MNKMNIIIPFLFTLRFHKTAKLYYNAGQTDR